MASYIIKTGDWPNVEDTYDIIDAKDMPSALSIASHMFLDVLANADLSEGDDEFQSHWNSTTDRTLEVWAHP